MLWMKWKPQFCYGQIPSPSLLLQVTILMLLCILYVHVFVTHFCICMYPKWYLAFFGMFFNFKWKFIVYKVYCMSSFWDSLCLTLFLKCIPIVSCRTNSFILNNVYYHILLICHNLSSQQRTSLGMCSSIIGI